MNAFDFLPRNKKNYKIDYLYYNDLEKIIKNHFIGNQLKNYVIEIQIFNISYYNN